MGRKTVYECDNPACTVYVEATNVPKQWYIVLTAHDEGKQRSENDQLTLCSNRCMAIMAVERANDVDGERLKLTQQRTPRGEGSKIKTTAAPGLVQFMAENGKEGKATGAIIGAHNRHKRVGTVKDDCLVCIWEANQDG